MRREPKLVRYHIRLLLRFLSASFHYSYYVGANFSKPHHHPQNPETKIQKIQTISLSGGFFLYGTVNSRAHNVCLVLLTLL